MDDVTVEMLAPDACSIPVGDPDLEGSPATSSPWPRLATPGNDIDSTPSVASVMTVCDVPAARDAETTLERIIEALVFSADHPLSLGKLAELTGERAHTRLRLAISDLNEKYRLAGLSFRIEALAGGYQMLTLAQYGPWVAKLHKEAGQTRLTDAALETLSVIAYRQPIIRADIEAVRGVACGDGLNRLRDMGLIKIVGRAEIVGRPMLYGTTRKFLDVFGLADLTDLPPMEALQIRRAAPAPVAEPLPAEPMPLAVAAGA